MGHQRNIKKQRRALNRLSPPPCRPCSPRERQLIKARKGTPFGTKLAAALNAEFGTNLEHVRTDTGRAACRDGVAGCPIDHPNGDNTHAYP